jgi:hypothetical protein
MPGRSADHSTRAMTSGTPDARDPIQGFSPAGQLLHLITGYWVSQAIYAAAELGIAGLLGRNGRSVDDLARATDTHAPSLYRLMRALASVGVFSESAPREFVLTPMGALLKGDLPGNLGAFSRLQGDSWHWRSWGAITASIRAGKPAVALGAVDNVGWGSALDTPHNCFDYLARHADAAAIFNAAMTGYSAQVHAAVAESYDFSDARLIADIGGGQGALLASILADHPQVRGILFDRSEVVRGAQEIFAQYAVAERCTTVVGDFFEEIPAGADRYVLCAVMHDWDDERAAAILGRVAARLTADARVLIVENVIPPGNEAHPGKLIDLEMLLMTGGRERTEAEFRDLANLAGLKIERVVQTAVSVSIIEARRA